MEGLRRRRPRLILQADEYRSLRNQVLERDGWKCQNCGGSMDLQVHHLVSRAQLGPDTADNLITLCARCHRHLHTNLSDQSNLD